MPSDLSKYLATHYLVADPPSKPSTSKKRKRKEKSTTSNSNLLITDDADADISSSRRHPTAGNSDSDDDNGSQTATVAGTSAEFRKSARSAWKVVGAPVPVPVPSRTKSEDHDDNINNDDDGAGPAEADEANAVLASTIAESSARAARHDDEAPAVVMSDGSHAGLQTAAAVSAQLSLRRRAERAQFEKGTTGKQAETVYRDATGRRVDVSMKRAEARRLAVAAETAEAERTERQREALRGDVQREAAEKRREALDDLRTKGVARFADDEELNRDMRGQTRWGDTMAQFIGSRGGQDGEGGKALGKGVGKKGGKRIPTYQGAAPPNRYGIRPGYRWDGVDRGNGFEAQRFKAMNRVERNKGLEYNWQMDE